MPSFAPFGYCAGFQPTLGDDEEDGLVTTGGWLTGFAAPGGATPTTDWSSLLRSGCRIVYGRLVEGIPYVWGERKLYTVKGVEAGMPSTDYTLSTALMVRQGDGVSQEIDRQKGLADGRALDLVLRRETLEDESILATLFKTPSQRARLSATVSDPTATVFSVTASPSVPWNSTSGIAYIGRECIRYSSQSSTVFAGITRGVAGIPHYHRSSAASGYSEVTDTPVYWRGRFVVEFEHLCGPDGRFLGDNWCSVGLYCRESWKGTIDTVPSELVEGKSLRCLPLVRQAAKKIGAKITGHPLRNADGSPKLYWTASDTITARGAATVSSGPVAFNDAIQQLRDWAIMCQAGLGANWTAYVDDRSTSVTFTYLAGASNQVIITPRAWFLTGGNLPAWASQRLLLGPFAPLNSGWLVIAVDQTEDATADDVPTSGILRITIGSQTEVAAFDGVHRDADKPDVVALRIVARGIGGTPRLDPWMQADSATVSIVSGYQGKWSESFRAMATSSGMGIRGLYDTLGFGFGCSIPEEWIDVDAITGNEPMGSTWVDATIADDTTIADTLCGWLALWQKALVQRRNDAGRIVLTVVDTTIGNDPSATSIGVDDVLLGGNGPPTLMEAPNIIEIDAGDKNPKAIPRDRSRMNAEGDRRWTLKATGAQQADVVGWAQAILNMGDGQETVALELPSYSETQVGDARNLTTAHPLTYDVGAAVYRPSSIPARVMTHEADRYTGAQKAGLLVPGQAPSPVLLCPSARAKRAYSTDTVEVEDGHQARFAAGYKVYVYEPGSEATRKQAMTVSSVSTSPSRIQMTGSLPSWVDGNTVITFDDITTDVAAQQGYMFVRASKLWQ